MPEHVSKIKRIGLPEKFADEYGNQNTLLNTLGINKNLIIKLIKSQS